MAEQFRSSVGNTSTEPFQNIEITLYIDPSCLWYWSEEIMINYPASIEKKDEQALNI